MLPFDRNLAKVLCGLSLIGAVVLTLFGLAKTEFFNGAAALAACSAIFYSIISTSERSARERQIQMLQIAGSSLEQAIVLCGQTPPNRGKWLQAARLCANARNALEPVKDEDLLLSKRLLRAEYREKFRAVLGFDDFERRGSFYYGHPEIIDIAEAFETSRNETDHYSGSEISITGTKLRGHIAEQSLVEIFQWTTFGVDDELIEREARFSDDEIDGLVHDAPAMYEYLRHARRTK